MGAAQLDKALHAPPRRGAWITRLSRRLLALLLRRIRHGSLIVVEGEQQTRFGSGSSAAIVQIQSGRAWPRLLRGSRGLAETFAERLWDSPDPVAVIRLAARNARSMDRLRALAGPVLVPVTLARELRPRNSRHQSRLDIAAHYDLGNELFSRMLDRTMTYSCALFERARMTLEQAQLAKLERICRRLDLGPQDHVLEIGTGWGGFALHAAATRGCRVTTTTISREQHDYALEQVRRAGLVGRVSVVMEDYRDLRGRYDKLVSIEMIEAVGWRHLGTFFSRCSQLLAPHGAMLLQAITVDDRAYRLEKTSRGFIKTYIFPGGCLPSLEAIMHHVARRTDMQTVQVEDLTPHYVETLRRWRERFTSHAAELERLGYDERFRRLWTLYLAYCEAGFAERRILDFQVLLAKPRSAIPAAAMRMVPARQAQPQLPITA